MKKEESRAGKVIGISFSLMLFGVLIAILMTADLFDRSYRKNIVPFSEGWEASDGEQYDLSALNAGDVGDGVIFMKRLPKELTNADSLCFETRNSNVRIWVEDSEIYSFTARENLSGMGYGRAFHEVGLSELYAGKTIAVSMSGVYEGHRGGKLMGLCIAPASEYLHLQVDERILSVILSMIILFFGVILILIFIWIPGKERLPFDIAALGLSAFTLGAWLFVDTGILQLQTGRLFVWRGIDRILIFFAAFPMVTFFNSLTAKKRVIYQKIWFAATIGFVVALVGCRYFAGVDMIESFPVFLAVYTAGLLFTILCIFIDNAIYCRRYQISVKMRHFFIGTCVLLVCAAIDLVSYSVKPYSVESYGNVTRIGAVAFIFIMLLQFLDWWTKDQATIGRERFVNRILQDSVASKSPDDSIRAILSYIGEELLAGRVMLFEERAKEKYHATYEWRGEGRDPGALELLYLPYHGFLDDLYADSRANGNRLVVDDVEACRTKNSELYNLLSSNHVTNLVTSPLEVNDKLVGVFALVDVPKQALSDAAEIMGYISYFLAQLILRRDEVKRLRYYSYNDTLSGALNRRAYREYIDKEMDATVPFGYLLCEIDGLKDANTAGGYEAGDRMVRAVADNLSDIFGKDRVYRVGGSQFAAFGSESEEAYFDNDVDRFRRKTEQNNIRVFVGKVFCIYGTRDISAVTNRAKRLLDDEKKGERLSFPAE